MSEATVKADAPPAPKPSKPSKLPIVVGILSVLFSAGGAFGGAFLGSKIGVLKASGHPPPPVEVEAGPKPPGLTVNLDPFVLTTTDVNKKAHALRVSVALEFEATAHEDVIKTYVPRMRDAMLTYLRSLTLEEAVDSAHSDKMKTELLERVHATGVHGAEHILITDMITQ